MAGGQVPAAGKCCWLQLLGHPFGAGRRQQHAVAVVAAHQQQAVCEGFQQGCRLALGTATAPLPAVQEPCLLQPRGCLPFQAAQPLQGQRIGPLSRLQGGAQPEAPATGQVGTGHQVEAAPHHRSRPAPQGFIVRVWDPFQLQGLAQHRLERRDGSSPRELWQLAQQRRRSQAGGDHHPVGPVVVAAGEHGAPAPVHRSLQAQHPVGQSLHALPADHPPAGPPGRRSDRSGHRGGSTARPGRRRAPTDPAAPAAAAPTTPAAPLAVAAPAPAAAGAPGSRHQRPAPAGPDGVAQASQPPPAAGTTGPRGCGCAAAGASPGHCCAARHRPSAAPGPRGCHCEPLGQACRPHSPWAQPGRDRSERRHGPAAAATRRWTHQQGPPR